MINGYFDLFAGVSGDMLVGAFLDSGVDFTKLQSELTKLELTGYRITRKKTLKNGIGGTKFNVNVDSSQPIRNLRDIQNLLEKSRLSERVKQNSLRTFKLLAEKEAAVHRCDIGDIHFHEIGGVDSIIDIVSVFICDQLSAIDRYYCSKVHIGSGFTLCQHGKIPVPSPATVALLSGLPTFTQGIPAELTTPTGAALLNILVEEFDNYPPMTVKRTGYGAGSRELEIPNLLRLIVGETGKAMTGNKFQSDQVILIQTNIDDMNPEYYQLIMEKLMQAGSVDVFLEQVIMKNSRPGVILNVITGKERQEKISELILTETSTFGLRFQVLNRRILFRKTELVKTEYGPVGIKLGIMDGEVIKIAPEYRDCRKISLENNIPLDQVYQMVKTKFNLNQESKNE